MFALIRRRTSPQISHRSRNAPARASSAPNPRDRLPARVRGTRHGTTSPAPHYSDLVGAILAAIDHPRARHQLMNVGMDEPVDYVRLGDHLARTRGLSLVPIRQRYHSTWLDNSKAKFLLGWRPQYNLERLADAAWTYERSDDDARRIWYPG